MEAARVERRLAAILAADVAGYSRLMERDEAGTLARLKAHRGELVEPLLAEHRGLSGDAEQGYFADGMVEDIIAGLSRIKWLFVVARNSSFTYKGKTVDVKRMGRELGVRYLLQGSLRKSERQSRPHLRADDRGRDRRPFVGRALRPSAR